LQYNGREIILSLNKRHSLGIVAGITLFLVPLNLMFMLPLSGLIVLLCAGKYSLAGLSLTKITLISLLFILLSANLFFFKMEELAIAVPFLVYPAALMLVSVLNLERSFIFGMANAIFLVFLVDSVFNIYTLTTSSDLFGRRVDFRPGDVFPRLGGIYANSFISIGISMSAFIASLVTKNRIITFLVVCLMPLSGAMRSPVLLLVAVCGCIVAHFVKSRITLFFLAIMCGSIVFGGIFLLSDVSSNALRIAALTFGATEIFESPLMGNSGYIPIDRVEGGGITLDMLLESGNAEQQLMNIGIHFGIPLLLIFMTIIYSLIPRSNSKLNSDSEDLFVKRVSVFIIIVDLIVTHLFSFFPFTVFSLIILLRLGKSRPKTELTTLRLNV